MKLLRYCIYLFMCVSVLVSCTQDDSSLSSHDSSKLSIQLQLGQPTRATIDGEDDLNENQISTVDIFLFMAEANENDAPIYSSSIPESSVTYNEDTKTASFDFDIPSFHYNKLFSDGRSTCKAYAIVNRPTGCELPTLEESSLSALKHLVISSSQFQVVDETSQEGENILTKQPLFVMDGLAENIIKSDDKDLSGVIPVKRAAVKIQLLLSQITDHIEDEGTSWTADKENVRITLRNGCNRAYLNEETPVSYLKPNKATDLFNLEDISLNAYEGGSNLTTSYPMYTYPTYWGNDDASRTYIVLTIDWKDDNNSNVTKTTYYEIPVNPAGNYLVRNNYYKITQTVNIIGSESEEDAVKLYPSNYVILDWGNTKVGAEKTETNAEISKLRYLVMEEPEVVMQNTTQKELFYYSSDPIEIRNLVIQKMDVSGNVAELITLFNKENLSTHYDETTKTYTITSTSLAKPVYLVLHSANPNIANDHDYILLKHELDNSMGRNSDYTEYIFTFDVMHTGNDENKLFESVRVEQYPMIAIKANLNSDYKNDNNSNNDNSNKGYVIINNQTGTSTNWSAVRGLASENNKNPNRYLISVSSLTTDASDDYIIGDPRHKTSSIPNSLSRDDNNHSLTYYYPTNREDATKLMISPQFLVASSYGVCNQAMSYSDAEKRCAAYQEDGYPAGRWRVPTKAEVKYIIQLSGWGVIPVLFNNGSDYWCAHGVIENSNGTVNDVTGSSAYVRCVYDSWYWGTEQQADKSKFVYGDKQR